MLLVILERRPHSMVYLRKFGRRLVEFLIYCQNYAGGWLEFHFMAQALPRGLVV